MMHKPIFNLKKKKQFLSSKVRFITFVLQCISVSGMSSHFSISDVEVDFTHRWIARICNIKSCEHG